jgi:hypothetical protein
VVLADFPVNRVFTGKFVDLRQNPAILARIIRLITVGCREFPCAQQQGIIRRQTGNFGDETGKRAGGTGKGSNVEPEALFLI